MKLTNKEKSLKEYILIGIETYFENEVDVFRLVIIFNQIFNDMLGVLSGQEETIEVIEPKPEEIKVEIIKDNTELKKMFKKGDELESNDDGAEYF
jgi:hypothetical protein